MFHDAPVAEADAAARDTVARLMPRLRQDLARLVEIPSVSAPGYPSATHGPLQEAYDVVAELLRDAGVQEVRALELPGTAPIVTGGIPAPAGAPTVLLYAHYDVVAAGEEALWATPPFAATERDGAVYGRGTADAKGNLLVHVGALRAWGGRPPVGVKVVIEGQEEVGSPLEEGVPAARPELFGADAILVADAGSIRAGQPSLTVSLRGDARVTVEVRTLGGDKHSGQYGGAAPDALLVLLHALASLHDERGDVAVAGLRREEWAGESYTDDEFRRLAEVEEGVPLPGSGSIGSRIWTGPAITVLGVDAPAVEGAAAAVQAHARAVLNVRVHPEQDAHEAQAAVIRHLEAQRPFGVPLKVTGGATGDGFHGRSDGVASAAMERALERAWGRPPVEVALGGAIPIVKAMAEGAPEAAMIVFGACDSFANIHGPNERLLLDEWERAIVAETIFLHEYAQRAKEAR